MSLDDEGVIQKNWLLVIVDLATAVLPLKCRMPSTTCACFQESLPRLTIIHNCSTAKEIAMMNKAMSVLARKLADFGSMAVRIWCSLCFDFMLFSSLLCSKLIMVFFSSEGEVSKKEPEN